MPDVSADGGSCIAGLDRNWVIPPCAGESIVLLADPDPARVREERQNFDPFGHYSRPDVLKLSVSKVRQRGVEFIE
jgi:nitrilase